MPEAPSRTELLGLPLDRLAAALAPALDRPFRARQVYDALYRRGVLEFGAMTEISAALRARLDAAYSITLPEVAEQRTAADGTTKFLLRLADGASIEAVDIPDLRRRTLCISSQAGCGLACAFCVTGFWGAGRNLRAAEIVGQVLLLQRLQQLPDSFNLVFMGMGEPLMNLDAVRDALEVLGERISPRRITVSTSGVIPGIEALGRWAKRPNLAISLHAPDDVRRSELMPVNRVYPIADLMAALRAYPLESRRRITVEYLLLDGYNDRLEDADALARLLRSLPSKVNLIPFNPDAVLPAWMQRPADATVDAFRDRLVRRGLTATVRRRRGHDVAAACGQLRAFARAPHGPIARRAGVTGASGASGASGAPLPAR